MTFVRFNIIDIEKTGIYAMMVFLPTTYVVLGKDALPPPPSTGLAW